MKFTLTAFIKSRIDSRRILIPHVIEQPVIHSYLALLHPEAGKAGHAGHLEGIAVREVQVPEVIDVQTGIQLFQNIIAAQLTRSQFQRTGEFVIGIGHAIVFHCAAGADQAVLVTTIPDQPDMVRLDKTTASKDWGQSPGMMFTK